MSRSSEDEKKATTPSSTPSTKSHDDGDAEKQLQQTEAKNSQESFKVDWDENDSMNPRNLSPARKWLNVAVVAVGSLLVTCTSSLYVPCFEQLMEEFGCSEEVAISGLSLYVFGMSIGPLLFGPMSEFYGRKPIYITSTGFFLLWLIPNAVAQNIETILVVRFLQGLSGSAFLGVAAGTVVDMFIPQQILIPMTVFTATPFVGPAAGPLIGGFINSFTEWRWCFYVSIIWAFVIFIGVCTMPETFHPVLLRKKAAGLRKSTGNDQYFTESEKALAEKTLASALFQSLTVPWKLLFQDPMITVLSTYTSLLQGILYLCFPAFQLVFGNNHHFNLWQVGLTFCGLAIGNLIACGCNPIWHKQWMGAIAKKKQQFGEEYKPEPELRLPPAMVGSVMITGGLFWFAWTTFPSVHWIVPIIATIPFAVGFFFAFQGVWTYKVAAYPKYAASAMAINTTTRSLFAGAFPLFTNSMYKNLGYQWASSIPAFLTLIMIPFPFLFYYYGPKIRAKSKFASA